MKPLLCCLLFVCAVRFTAIAGLDDSGEKKVTVRSEIARGREVVMDAYLEGQEPTLLSICLAMHKPITDNKKAGKDTPGFMLGGLYTEWTILVDMLNKPDAEAGSEDAQAIAKQDYAQFRVIQKDLALDDPALLEATGNHNVPASLARLIQWSAAGTVTAATASPAPQGALAPAQTVKESQSRALKKYPELAKAGSAMNAKFVEAYRKLQAANSPLLRQPDWPEKVADQCADPASVATR